MPRPDNGEQRRSAKRKPEPAAPIKSRELPSPFRLKNAGGAILMLVALLVVYGPALNGGFLWDDGAHVTRPHLQSLHGLWRIWLDVGATQQYYPFLYSAFWVEHGLWGDAVLGYHLTNLILHAASAFLLVLILRRLSSPGAWLAGFLFALHPVCVEAVAWISEQKSALSTVFYLASALVYLHFDQSRRRVSYFLALGLFLLALLSKTVTATLPAALLVVFWWLRGRLDWKRDALPLIPWFGIGAAGGLFTAWVERTHVGAQGPEYALTLLERFLLAGRVIWFYLSKLLWPANLIFLYPRWTVDPAVWWQYLFPVAVVVAAAGLWFVARPRRGPLAGFLFFCGTLFPALGFFNVYPFVYSYVADHFQYLASLGIIVPVAVAIARLDTRQAYAAGGVVAAVLGILTWRQSAMYRDAETLFTETLARNPGSWMAHNNLGNEILPIPGRLPEAITHFEAALRLKPDSAQAHYNLGLALSKTPGRLPGAIEHYQAALKIRPDYPEAENNLGIALATIPGRMPEAVEHYQAALRMKPDYTEARNNLAAALSNTPGRLPEAINQLQKALRDHPDSAEVHNNLGTALSETPSRLPEAIAEFEAALRINPGYAEVASNLADAHNNLGVALAQIPGREREAIPHFEAALQLKPNSAEVHYNLGSALMDIPDRLPDALAHFQTALRIQPDLEAARQMVSRLSKPIASGSAKP